MGLAALVVDVFLEEFGDGIQVQPSSAVTVPSARVPPLGRLVAAKDLAQGPQGFGPGILQGVPVEFIHARLVEQDSGAVAQGIGDRGSVLFVEHCVGHFVCLSVGIGLFRWDKSRGSGRRMSNDGLGFGIGLANGRIGKSAPEGGPPIVRSCRTRGQHPARPWRAWPG